MLFTSMIEAIGHTPLVRLALPTTPEVEVYAKLELANPFGMKDRVARRILLDARRTGALADGAPVVESSSGTMALGVALVGTALGHPVHIVTDPRIDEITLAKLRGLGVAVEVVPAMTGHGWQSARLERLAQLMSELPGAFWPQQYSNPDNPLAYRDAADEIVADLGHVDVLVGAVGSGGSLCGTSRALRRDLPDLRVVGVDATGSALFDQPDRPKRRQSGLGNSLLPANLDRSLIDEIHWLNDHEAFAATRDLVREQKIFGGNTSGSVYAVLRHVADQASPGSRVVGLLPDRGDRYVTTVYRDEYWDDGELTALPRRDTATPVTYGTPVDAWSRARPGFAHGRRLLFVEANTTGSGMRALTTATRMGYEPVLITGDPDRYAGLEATGAEVVRCNTNSLAALRATLPEQFRREDLAGVTTTSDFYALTAAELADRWTLAGPDVAAVATCRDKGRTREVLARAGVRQPGYARIREDAEVPPAVVTVGLPCVVKPVDDSGSNNVLLARSAGEVADQVSRIRATTTNVRGQAMAGVALVEAYLHAREYSVEMLGGPDGPICVGVTEKHLAGPPTFVESRHVFPADLPAATTEALVDTTRRALEAVGLRVGASHTELRLADGGPAVIEINARAAGGMIPELVRLTTGVDLLEQQITVAGGGTPAPVAPPRGAAGIAFLLAERDGTVRAVTGIEEAGARDGVEQVHVTAAVGGAVRAARCAYDRLGFVIARATTAADVHRVLDEATSAIHIELEDDPT